MAITEENMAFTEQSEADWLTDRQMHSIERKRKKNRVLSAGKKYRDSIPDYDKAEFSAMR